MGRQQRHDRTETVEKAMNLFWRNGYASTSMRDLEGCLDMRPGSIYANFGCKEQLYMEAMDLYAAKTFEDFQVKIDNAESFLEGLRQFIKQILFTPASPSACMLAKTLADLHPDNDALKEKARHIIANFENTLINELKKAREVHEISEECDIPSLARYIQVQIIGLRAYAEMRKPEPVINELVDDALKAIKSKTG